MVPWQAGLGFSATIHPSTGAVELCIPPIRGRPQPRKPLCCLLWALEVITLLGCHCSMVQEEADMWGGQEEQQRLNPAQCP